MKAAGARKAGGSMGVLTTAAVLAPPARAKRYMGRGSPAALRLHAMILLSDSGRERVFPEVGA